MKEAEIRDYIVENFDSFLSFISNHSQFKQDLKNETETIINENSQDAKVNISDLVKLTVIDKLNLALPVLTNLKLIEKEFQLLNTESGQGKQPSVDILAYNHENYCLALLELKISSSAEREAITELSAYNQGLHNKFRGLSSLEVIWLPISTEWRVTTKSAIEFEILWQNSFVMPLKLIPDYDDINKKVKNIELKCFNPTQDLTEIDCLNLFSYECFEAFDYYTMAPIQNKEAFINYVTTLCNRQNINGFVIFHKPVDAMYPYGFTLCVFNPYKGYLHRRTSINFIKENSETEFYSVYAQSGIINTDYVDIDFKTDELKYFEPKPEDMIGTSLRGDAYWEKDFLSVGKFADNMENQNINFLISRIKKMIDSNGVNSRAFGTPDFEGLFRKLPERLVDSVMYLGVHLELVSKRIHIEHKRGIHNNDFFTTISSFSYLKELFKEYNLK